MARKLLSIVIPVYNEEKRIPALIAGLKEFLVFAPIDCEVIFSVELSQDDSVWMLQREMSSMAVAPFKILSHPVRLGKGAAVRTGILAAQGDFILFTDADLPIALSNVQSFIDRVEMAADPCDLVIGHRIQPYSRGTPAELVRRAVSEIFRRVSARICPSGLEDTQCPFKLFSTSAARAIFSRQLENGYVFDVEVLLIAKEMGLKTSTVPVQFEHRSGSHLNLLRDTWTMLQGLLRLKRRFSGKGKTATAIRSKPSDKMAA